MPAALVEGLGYLVLLGPHVRRHPVEESVRDPAIELVHVHRVESLLDRVVLRFQAGRGLLVEAVLSASVARSD